MTLCIGRVLGGLHQRVARRLTERQPMKVRYGGWVYLPLENAMAEVVLIEVETYVSFRQNTVAHVIATRPNIDVCLAAEQRLESRVVKRWW